MSQQNGSPSPGALFQESVAIMSRLRGPGGCPWDREQNLDTIRKYTLEECYEVLDAIERRDWTDLCDLTPPPSPLPQGERELKAATLGF